MNTTTEQLTVALQELTQREQGQVYGNHACAATVVAVSDGELSKSVSDFLQTREKQLAQMRNVSAGKY